jgi:DNA-binding IclR family transcriptional regulator
MTLSPDAPARPLRPAAGAPAPDTSVTKALHLLDAFRTAGPVTGVSELARATGLPKSTVFRLLGQLERGRYVEHNGSGYRLARPVFELGSQVDECRPDGLRALAAPVLGDLFLHTRYVVHLAVLDGSDVLYLDKLHSSQSPHVPTVVGGRMRASCSALGKAMLPYGHDEATKEILRDGLTRRTRHSIAAPGLFLAELKRVRENRVAFDREEVALGLTCVASPVLVDGRAVAAVSVSGPTGRFDPAGTAARVITAADRIAALVAARPDHGQEFPAASHHAARLAS